MYHSLNNLFAQLGLPSDDASVARFIATHRPLSHEIELTQAPWWTEGQTAFLHEALEEDADWAIIVDELDSLLREQV